MKGKIYLSASDNIKETFQSRWDYEYTENLREADLVLIQKQADGTLSNEQFKDLVLAKELGKRVGVLMLKKDREKVLENTRRFLDIDMGME